MNTFMLIACCSNIVLNIVLSAFIGMSLYGVYKQSKQSKKYKNTSADYRRK